MLGHATISMILMCGDTAANASVITIDTLLYIYDVLNCYSVLVVSRVTNGAFKHTDMNYFFGDQDPLA